MLHAMLRCFPPKIDEICMIYVKHNGSLVSSTHLEVKTKINKMKKHKREEYLKSLKAVTVQPNMVLVDVKTVVLSQNILIVRVRVQMKNHPYQKN